MKKLFMSILMIASIMMIAWFVISYVDIVSNNLDNNPQYLPWNMFVWITENYVG